MKKVYSIVLMTCSVLVTNGQDFWIHPVGSTDACYPASVTLSVDSPQAGYTYDWFIYGGITCPAYPGNLPYGNSGASIQVEHAGVYYSVRMPSGGGIPEYSNDVTVRVLTTVPGFGYMPAPGLNSNNNCVTSSSFCIPEIYHAYWPFNTEIKWYRNNTLINGEYSFTYTATSEGYYKYSITSDCITAFSDSTYVTVLPSAQVTANGSTTFCSGGNVLLNAPTGNNKTYQWKKGGADISGATLSSYTATTGGTYKVTVTNTVTGCSKTTASGTVVTINPVPAATITPQGSTTFCAGGSVLLKGNSGTGLTYQWKKGGNNIAGATNKNYTATLAGVYKIKVTNSFGCTKLSTGVTVTVPCRDETEGSTHSSETSISVFPNPAHSEINILSPSKEYFVREDSYGEIEIVNALGEILISRKNENRINISDIPGGIYFVKVFFGNSLVTEKFVKQ